MDLSEKYIEPHKVNQTEYEPEEENNLKRKQSEADAVKTIYMDVLPNLKSIVYIKNKSFLEAQDVFQEAVIEFLLQFRKGKIKTELNPDGYFFIIAKNKWKKHIKKLEKEKRNCKVISDTESESNPPEALGLAEKEELFLAWNSLAHRYRELIRLRYYENLDYSEICELLGYTSIESARTQKNKSINKLRESYRRSE